MKKTFLCIYIFLFSSCVDVKIASSLDKTSYFTFQNLLPQKVEVECKTFSKLALLDIYVYAPYNDTSIYIFDTQNLQITTLEGKKWISSPKDMLQTLFILKSKKQEECFELLIPPFGTQKLDRMLKLSLLSLQILHNQHSYQAQMSVFYEFSSMKNQQTKSGMIESLVPLDSLDDNSLAPSFAKASDEVFSKLLEALKEF